MSLEEHKDAEHQYTKSSLISRSKRKNTSLAWFPVEKRKVNNSIILTTKRITDNSAERGIRLIRLVDWVVWVESYWL